MKKKKTEKNETVPIAYFETAIFRPTIGCWRDDIDGGREGRAKGKKNTKEGEKASISYKSSDSSRRRKGTMTLEETKACTTKEKAEKRVAIPGRGSGAHLSGSCLAGTHLKKQRGRKTGAKGRGKIRGAQSSCEETPRFDYFSATGKKGKSQRGGGRWEKHSTDWVKKRKSGNRGDGASRRPRRKQLRNRLHSKRRPWGGENEKVRKKGEQERR